MQYNFCHQADNDVLAPLRCIVLACGFVLSFVVIISVLYDSFIHLISIHKLLFATLHEIETHVR